MACLAVLCHASGPPPAPAGPLPLPESPCWAALHDAARLHSGREAVVAVRTDTTRISARTHASLFIHAAAPSLDALSLELTGNHWDEKPAPQGFCDLVAVVACQEDPGTALCGAQFAEAVLAVLARPGAPDRQLTARRQAPMDPV